MKLAVEEDDLLLTQSRLVGLKEFFIGTGKVRINKLAGFLRKQRLSMKHWLERRSSLELLVLFILT